MVRRPYSSGFTVIEVTLFLAISGLMIVGMFVGVSGSINRQRYDDAVKSFQDFVQGQYNIVDNVRNNRPTEYVCNTATGTIASGSSDISRGMSDCMVVGRLITTTDGHNFISEPIIATGTVFDTTHTETALIDSLGLVRMPAGGSKDDETYRVAWDTYAYTKKDDHTARSAQLLILRMPTSGIVRTYFRTTPPTADLSPLWKSSSEAQLTLCIESDGMTLTPPTGVRVLKDAINTNSVQFITAGENGC